MEESGGKRVMQMRATQSEKVRQGQTVLARESERNRSQGWKNPAHLGRLGWREREGRKDGPVGGHQARDAAAFFSLALFLQRGEVTAGSGSAGLSPTRRSQTIGRDAPSDPAGADVGTAVAPLPAVAGLGDLGLGCCSSLALLALLSGSLGHDRQWGVGHGGSRSACRERVKLRGRCEG